MPIRRVIVKLAAAGLLGLATGALHAAPGQIEVAGRELVTAGQATRQKMLMDLYRVTLYLPSRDAGMDRITRESVPKAFHIEVLYDGSMPAEIPEEWADELLPPLSDEKAQELRRVYASLEQGDEILITYAPDRPTTVKLNGETVFTDSGRELMAGTIDVFLGPNPVSDDVRKSLLGRAQDDGWLF